METTIQTNLFDAFRYFERLLPDSARTGLFNPAAQSYVRGSASRPVATVLERRNETGDTVTFLLRTAENYPSFQPGQHIDVAVEINGVRTVRQYSLTGSTKERALAITVKRATDGKVSNHLHDHIHAGAQVEISVPRGEFAMPATDHSTYLFFSAGSGITPIYAMVRALLEQGAWGDIHFFHAAKNPNSVIFREDLKRLAAEYDNFHPHFFYSEGTERNRLSASSAMVLLQNAAVGESGISQSEILDRTIHPAHTPVRLCGAGDFVQALENDLKELQYLQIQSEYYTLPRAGAVGEGTASFLRSRSAVKVETNLLEAAEAAGLKPKHGCRRGICHECKAHKRSGTVKNLLNGKESSGREDIQLCITQPIGEVEIDL